MVDSPPCEALKGKLMFIGEYHHTVDEKGRIAIPARFRKALQKGGVVTKGLDGCLVLYAQPTWLLLAEKLAALPITSAGTRAFTRLMLAGAMEVRLDVQGRIIVPDYLRQYGDFQKHVVIAGLYNRVELWDEERWQAYRKNTEHASEEIAEKLSNLGV